MSEERLELVTDFAALRAGMIVVITDCRGCGRHHRKMLTIKRPRKVRGVFNGPPCWIGLPACRPQFVTSPETVQERRVYRVVDGLDPEADKRSMAITETAAALDKLRVRP